MLLVNFCVVRERKISVISVNFYVVTSVVWDDGVCC